MDLKEKLLDVMDTREHPSDGEFTRTTLENLCFSSKQEFGVYVRDFPYLLKGIIKRGPLPPIKKELEGNYQEEAFGTISGLNRPHVELYLHTQEKLGFSRADFFNAVLLPESQKYRDWLWKAALSPSHTIWESLAVTTIFLEGSNNERETLKRNPVPLTEQEIKHILENHYLVKHYGCKPEDLLLKLAHLKAEGDHRASAWKIIGYIDSEADKIKVLGSVQRSRDLRLEYREAIAKECGMYQYLLAQPLAKRI
jgi:hypothetical protein